MTKGIHVYIVINTDAVWRRYVRLCRPTLGGSPMRRVISKAVRPLVATAVSLLMALGLVAATSAPATAGSSGCNYYTWGGACQEVNGTGTYVQHVAGSFWRTRSPLCNWQTTAEFFDVYGRWYMTRTSRTHYSCDWTGWDYAGVYSYVREGFVCTSIRSNGSAVGSRCASIHR